MHLACCGDIEAFNQDRLRDQQWSYRFPGSGWITCLYRIADEIGISVASGDVAIANVTSKKWDAKDVYVIQDMRSRVATKLLDLGAHPFLITCLEAPLYEPFFYDEIDHIANHFKFSLGFGFSNEQRSSVISRKNIPFRFPSFYLNDIQEIQPWQARKKLVLVASNKYRSDKLFLPTPVSLMSILRQLKWCGIQVISPSYRKSLALSLLERRLEVIEYFSKKNELGLYGAGWDNLNGLPSVWSSKLKNVLKDQYLGRCTDKLKTIGSYKFSICFENMESPGYMTEKIVDCFVAGSIPIYWGAPDIAKLVPCESYIDMRHFDSFEKLEICINSMTEQKAMKMLEAGQDYLKTTFGMLHNYEGFARNVILLTQEK